VDSFGDHRIAMAASVIAMNFNGNVKIKNSESVGVSFPEFFEILESIR